MTLTTTQKSIEQLLTGDRQYQIPDFQRPYVWEEPQAIALVNDLLGAWRTDDGDYFLGSIVLVEHDECDNADIIDGQQRLTSLCILVSLLRHLAGEDACCVSPSRASRVWTNGLASPCATAIGSSLAPSSSATTSTPCWTSMRAL